ncbi:MAG: PadR family transcriptional regulator [Rhodanobacter sp.]|nr:MAG: PadR family transcriptional regulator [Rhodanobacter sp.]
MSEAPASRRSGRHLAAFALLELARNGSLHGLGLQRVINDLLPDALQVDAGNLYRVLREMEGRDAVSSSWDTSASGPARRMYAITPAGRRELKSWAEDIRQRRAAFDTFLEQCEQLDSDASGPAKERTHG